MSFLQLINSYIRIHTVFKVLNILPLVPVAVGLPQLIIYCWVYVSLFCVVSYCMCVCFRCAHIVLVIHICTLNSVSASTHKCCNCAAPLSCSPSFPLAPTLLLILVQGMSPCWHTALVLRCSVLISCHQLINSYIRIHTGFQGT
jgi:hypothetical protein